MLPTTFRSKRSAPCCALSNEYATVWLLEADTYVQALHRLRASAKMAPVKNWVHRTVHNFTDAVAAKKRKAELMAVVTDNIQKRQARKQKNLPST